MTPPNEKNRTDIEKRLVLKAASEPRSEWALLALEAAERIEELKGALEGKADLQPPPK